MARDSPPDFTAVAAVSSKLRSISSGGLSLPSKSSVAAIACASTSTALIIDVAFLIDDFPFGVGRAKVTGRGKLDLEGGRGGEDLNGTRGGRGSSRIAWTPFCISLIGIWFIEVGMLAAEDS